MKTEVVILLSALKRECRDSWLLVLTFLVTCSMFGGETVSAVVNQDSDNPLAFVQANSSIPWQAVDAMASKQCPSEALAVSASHEGALLRCTFQRLEGKATT